MQVMSTPRTDGDTRATAPPRSFPPPWTVEETEASFIVKDQAGRSLAYVYFEEEPGLRAAAFSPKTTPVVGHVVDLAAREAGYRLIDVLVFRDIFGAKTLFGGPPPVG
jgi:hypothetical protein